jgi:hypothetical protein
MKRRVLVLLSVLALLALVTTVALADDVPSFDFATPLFGLAAAPDGSLLVADTGAGIVELRHGEGSMVAFMPGVTDIAPIGRGSMFAITGGGEDPTAGKVFRVSRGSQREIADLKAYEEANNPDGGLIDSNPFDVAALSGGYALVADAGGNSLLMADNEGNIDWVATLPPELASTANAKALVGCPTPPPDFAFVCDLPAMIPAEAVATSVAIGPDGAYYVGELKGFPAPVGVSKVWRIEPGTLHAECGTSPACSVVYSDFTSIIDLAFGPDGKLYVVEFEEATWLAVELFAFYGLPVALHGGTISTCDADGGGCSEVLGSVMFPTAVAVDKKGAGYATVGALIYGAAEVIALP